MPPRHPENQELHRVARTNSDFGCLTYLDELHHQVEFRGRVHLLHQHDDVGVFDLPQHRDLVLDEVLLHTRMLTVSERIFL